MISDGRPFSSSGAAIEPLLEPSDFFIESSYTKLPTSETIRSVLF